MKVVLDVEKGRGGKGEGIYVLFIVLLVLVPFLCMCYSSDQEQAQTRPAIFIDLILLGEGIGNHLMSSFFYLLAM